MNIDTKKQQLMAYRSLKFVSICRPIGQIRRLQIVDLQTSNNTGCLPKWHFE